MAAQTYTNEQKVAVLATLAANGGNVAKTAKESGVSRQTLHAWIQSDRIDLTHLDTIKKELTDSYVEKLRLAREKLIDRITTVAGTEKDLFKLSGAFKIVSEASAEQEVQEALAAAIRERANDMN